MPSAELSAPRCKPAPPGSIDRGRPLAVAIVGMSTPGPCGVRDHAGLLAGALQDEGVSCALHWLDRDDRALRAELTEVRAWATALRRKLGEEGYDAVIWQYSVFAYSHRGLPIFVPSVLSVLRSTRLPLLGFMHELAFPWRLDGVRGAAWAISQRAVLIDIVRACSGLIVTTDFRAQWLAERRWLARRPLALAPVYSNLPAPGAPASERKPDGGAAPIGMFGYAYDERTISLVLDALAPIRASGRGARLVLLGAPGRESQLAEHWLNAARERDLVESIEFAGPLPAQQLSDAIAACEVLLFADRPGPTSRKGTLAGALASGRPLIALDGPRTWRELVQYRAARVVAPDADSLTEALVGLLADREARAALGARGRDFAERRMGLGRSTAATLEMLDALVAGRSA